MLTVEIICCIFLTKGGARQDIDLNQTIDRDWQAKRVIFVHISEKDIQLNKNISFIFRLPGLLIKS